MHRDRRHDHQQGAGDQERGAPSPPARGRPPRIRGRDRHRAQRGVAEVAERGRADCRTDGGEERRPLPVLGSRRQQGVQHQQAGRKGNGDELGFGAEQPDRTGDGEPGGHCGGDGQGGGQAHGDVMHERDGGGAAERVEHLERQQGASLPAEHPPQLHERPAERMQQRVPQVDQSEWVAGLDRKGEEHAVGRWLARQGADVENEGRHAEQRRRPDRP
jgi:hypothetical protein